MFPVKFARSATSIKIPMTFLHSARTNNCKIFMKIQKTPNRQNNLEKEEQSWRYCTP